MAPSRGLAWALYLEASAGGGNRAYVPANTSPAISVAASSCIAEIACE